MTVASGSEDNHPEPPYGPVQAPPPKGAHDRQTAVTAEPVALGGDPAEHATEDAKSTTRAEPEVPEVLEDIEPEAPEAFEEIEPPEIGDPGSQREFISQLATPWPGRADTVIDAGISGVLEVRAASIRGKAHRDRRESPFSVTRQDEYCFQLTADGQHLVIFVADGVSAGEESHMAAAIVARRGCAIVTGMLEGGAAPSEIPWSDVTGQLSTVIVREWLKRKTGPFDAQEFATKTAEEANDLRRACATDSATTAIAAVIATSADTDGSVPFNGVVLAGDSSLWLLEPAYGWRPLSSVKNEGAEIASNVTHGLPLIGEPLPIGGTIAEDAALFMMSDGLGDPLGGGGGEVGRYLAARWRRPPSSYGFAATLDFYRRTFDDDRTAVGIWVSTGIP